MSERDAFDGILASLHEASLDDARWPATSGLIDDAIRAEGNSLAFGAGAPDQVQIHYVWVLPARAAPPGARTRLLPRLLLGR